MNTRLFLPAFALAAAILAAACDVQTGEGASDIFARSETVVARRPGAVAGPLLVQVMGPPIQGVPGRNGYRDPVAGEEVTFDFRREWEDRARWASETEGENGGDLQPARGAEAPAPAFLPAAAGAGRDWKTEIPEEEGGLVAKVTTDEHGFAGVDVQLGWFVGDYRVRAEIRNRKQQRRSVEFLVLSGLEVLETTEREGPPGSLLDVNVQVWKVVDTGEGSAGEEVTGSPGDEGGDGDADAPRAAGDARDRWRVEPEVDRRVFFTVLDDEGDAGAARLEEGSDRTNSSGIATLKMRLGDRSGRYRVLAELEQRDRDGTLSPITRGVVIERYALSGWELGLSLLGGVALFVVGLRLLAAGLRIQVSPSLRAVTEAGRRHRAAGFIGGAVGGVTFLSSSAVLSHLISFANGGLLSASAASAHVLGANFGRTFLILVLAFTGVASLGIPMAAAATLLLMLPARLGWRTWGMVLLGGGLTLFGWSLLLDSAGLVELSPGLRATVASWDPWSGSRGAFAAVGVFAGDVLLAAVVAMVTRSSNVAVAGAMAFAGAGLLSPAAVIPVFIGAGLGSSAVALVGAWRRNREARLLALGQVLAQAGGGVWLVALTLIPAGGAPLPVRLADWLTPGMLLHSPAENVTHHVAVVYVLFHLANGLLLLAVDPWIRRLAQRIVPRDPVADDIKPFRLDPGLLDVPSLALAQATREVCYLGELVRKAVAESFDALRYLDLNLTDQISRRQESISSVGAGATQYLLGVAEHDLSRHDAARLEGLQAATASFARIGELGEQLCQLTSRIVEETREIPEDLVRELSDLYELVINQFENVLHILEVHDPRIEENAMKTGERISKSAARIDSLWLQRLRHPEGAPPAPAAPDPAAAVLVLLTRQAYDVLVQVAGHLTHIAERVRLLRAG